METIAKPDLSSVLEYYGVDTSRLSETGWSRRKVLCPVHDDHSPSMTVNLEEQKTKCWACPAGGDSYDLIMAKEGIDFNEAKRFAADHFGVEVTQVRSASSGSRYVPSWADEDDG